MGVLSEFAQKTLQRGTTPDGIPDKDNPFVVRGKRAFARFDSIEIVRDGDDVVTWFCWHGRRIMAAREEGVQEWGEKIKVTGVTGEQEIFVERTT